MIAKITIFAKIMASNRNFVYYFRTLGRKHRLSLHDQHDETEEWYMFISPLKVIAVMIAVLLILFIIILSLAAYTPILNFIPGYAGGSQREQMIQNILRVDSIEHRLNDMEEWGRDVSLIMEGRTPFMRDASQRGDSITVTRPETVARSHEDSLLRNQMEGNGIYSLGQLTGQRTGGEVSLQPPVRGVVSARFSPKDERFGVGVATVDNQQVLAVAEGTVIASAWSPEGGYIIQIQHADNLVSIYKRLSQALPGPGTRVRKGEVVGYTGDGASGEEGKGLFELELWHNGTPVDPENYIIF